MKRNLHRCPICREWFNTTSAVMIDHYRTKHEFAHDKAARIAELVVTRATLRMRAGMSPFPLSMQYETAAVMAQVQIDAVMAAQPTRGML